MHSILRRAELRQSIVAAWAVLVFLAAAPLAAQQAEVLGKPSRQSQRISVVVAALMEREHLSKHQLDNVTSEHALSMYIKNLDPLKMYFLKSDIEEFRSKYGDALDEMMPEGDYTAAFAVFERFLQRVDEQVAVANELIDAKHDYSIHEEMVTDADSVDFANTKEELNETWRKRIKYNLLVFGSDDEKDNPDKKDPRERLRNRYRAFANRMRQFDNEDVIELYISAITTTFDPHTSYMSKSSYQNFIINMRLELDGIGATLQSTDDGLTVIRRIVPGGAADKSGELNVDDKIVAVGQGADGEMVDILDMKLDDVVDKIRGKAGSVVRLSVMRAGTSEINNVSITRERIELKDSEARGVVFEAGEKAGGGAYKIGVVDLPSFYTDMEGRSSNSPDFKSTTVDVKRILDDFTAQGVDAVVLDLRRNGGGSLPEAIDCTGLFIDHGPVVQTKSSNEQVRVDNDQTFGMSWNGPLVVLTSKFSASASEILAGAVQDYQRGLIVGDTSTHGKGTVQTLVDLAGYILQTRNAPPTLGALKITISQFYRPNGDSTQKRGVLSDIVMPSITDHMDVSESDLDYALEFDRVSPARFTPLGMVSPELVQDLTTRSQERVAASDKFQKDIKLIEKYVEQKKDTTVSLNIDDFMERRKELDADREEEKLMEDQANYTNSDIKRDYFMDEILNITVDYVRALGNKPLAQNR
jgi:carboxyl-terminal processing protease